MKIFVCLTLVLFYSEVYSQTRLKANRILNYDYQSYFKVDTPNHDQNSLRLIPINKDSIFKEEATYVILKKRMTKRQFEKYLAANKKGFMGTYYSYETLSNGIVNGLYFQDYKLITMPEIDGLYSTYLFQRYLHNQSSKGKNEVRIFEYRLTVSNRFFPQLFENTSIKNYNNFIEKIEDFFNKRIIIVKNGF